MREIEELSVEEIIEEPMQAGTGTPAVANEFLAEQVFGKNVAELIAEIEARRADRRPTIRDLPLNERKAYQAEAVRRHRAKVKREKALGNPAPTKAAVREALADAALMLLAVEGPGADQVRSYLSRAFPGRVGVSMTVTSRARSGKLRPTSLKSN